MGYKDAKKIDFYTYSIQKWLYIKEIFTKMLYVFFNKRCEMFHKI